MNNLTQIQEHIFLKTGLKVSIANIKTGSMKGYVRLRPKRVNKEYVMFPFEFIQELKPMLKDLSYGDFPVFCSTSEIYIPVKNLIV